VVRLDLWRERIESNIAFIQSNIKTTEDEKKIKGALSYYQKVIPKLYRGTAYWVGLIQKIKVSLDGLRKVTYREVTAADLRVVAHKSTALAAQNFMMSMAAQGYDTCPMEGFDSQRLKKILGLPKKAQISMVIGCGIRKPEGVYGERFRIPFKDVYKEL
jgi:nitroreductase